MSQSSFDIVVIGAGAAGIAAARRLAGHPLSVAVLEARDRVGGRAWSVQAGGDWLDMGCGWLHSADENAVARLAEAAGAPIDKTRPPWERQAFDHEMTPAEQTAMRQALNDFEDRVAKAAAEGRDGPASELFEPDGRWNARIDAISGALNGARFAEVSIQDYDAYRDTGVNWRLPGGYGRFVGELGEGLPIRLGCVVSRVDMTGSGVRLETSQGVIDARAVVVTVPTDLIASGRLRIEPVPHALMEAAAGAPLGLADKLHMAVTGADDFPPDSQLWGRSDTAETGGYHLRPFGREMIEGYFGADLARGLDAEGPDAMFAFVVDELVSLLGSGMRRRLSPLAASRWGTEPFSGGGYSHVLPGHAGARAALRAPIADRLFIAGEATSDAFYGTVHGAWTEGERAADQALAALGLDRRLPSGDTI